MNMYIDSLAARLRTHIPSRHKDWWLLRSLQDSLLVLDASGNGMGGAEMEPLLDLYRLETLNLAGNDIQEMAQVRRSPSVRQNRHTRLLSVLSRVTFVHYSNTVGTYDTTKFYFVTPRHPVAILFVPWCKTPGNIFTRWYKYVAGYDAQLFQTLLGDSESPSHRESFVER